MDRIRTSWKLFIPFALCLGIAGACKGSDTSSASSGTPVTAAPVGGATFACTKAGDWCLDYSGDAIILGEDGLRGMCGAMSGTLASGACSTAKALGSCNLGKGQVKTYYASETNNAASAKSDCDLHDGKYAAK